MFSIFISRKMLTAEYKILKDGSYFGEVPSCKGVWVSAKNLELCRKELQEVLEGWMLLKVRDRQPVPGFRMISDRRRMVKYA